MRALCFSPTGTTKKLAETICEQWKIPLEDITLQRKEIGDFSHGIFLAFPVYAGRMPDVMAEIVRAIKSKDAPAIILANYGNRDYDDALLEAKDLLEKNGFHLLGAAAFVSEHSYSKIVAGGRPNQEDLKKAVEFAEKVSEKYHRGDDSTPAIPGNYPYREKMMGEPEKPLTRENCVDCKRCAKHCPMGIIHWDDVSVVDDGCLLCCSCVKICPVDAKYFGEGRVSGFRKILEEKYMEPKQPEFFL
ncbi:MAG: EFR1 family ferrodoxin [Tissierellia bacterium]|nr:EFR1 family ferrodoxin [Tissierellia bacterium]